MPAAALRECFRDKAASVCARHDGVEITPEDLLASTDLDLDRLEHDLTFTIEISMQSAGAVRSNVSVTIRCASTRAASPSSGRSAANRLAAMWRVRSGTDRSSNGRSSSKKKCRSPTGSPACSDDGSSACRSENEGSFASGDGATAIGAGRREWVGSRNGRPAPAAPL